MIWSVIGCGSSAQNWKPEGLSIGVNDCWKFGNPTDYLLVCNRPDQFTKERYETIVQSIPKVFLTYKNCWSAEFPNRIRLSLKPWYGNLHKGAYYSANTSPFIAMTYAFGNGAKEIILWGVDFVDHHMYNTARPDESKRELECYRELIEEMELQGTKTFLGCKGSVLESFVSIK